MYIIGIDTGGTYTDGVILDYDTKEVIKKIKVFTTKENLHICIGNCFEALNFDAYDQVAAVCISTTLATNAIVENTQCPSGTILIGKTPEGEMPVSEYKFLSGILDIKGYIKIPLEDEEIDKIIRDFKEENQELEAIAVSGYASTRNPEFELRVKRKIQKELGLPVACAHELTTMLGFRERTITAVLNAGLIPVITELVSAVKGVFQKYEVDASYMVVDGTGCLMSSNKVMDQPICTILSGPSSTIPGAHHLTKIQNGLIVDIGGTTTDIALVKNGKIALNEEGARVGPWMTRTRAAQIRTFGLGGDTRIYQTRTGGMILSNYRVWPISHLVQKYPYLLQEMKQYATQKNYKDIECFVAYREAKIEGLSETEKRFLDLLKDGAHCRAYLREKLQSDLFQEIIDRMLVTNRILGGGFTPTDLMHVRKMYDAYDGRGAEFALQYMLECSGRDRAELIENITDMILDRLQKFCNTVFQESGMVKKLPIVCIGAPAKCWMELAKERFENEIIVPEHAEVANAIGAAVGNISPIIHILIRLDQMHSEYLVFMPNKRVQFATLDEAKTYARMEGRKLMEKQMEENLCRDFEVEIDDRDITCKDLSGEPVYVETQIKVMGTGIPDLYEPQLVSDEEEDD